MSGFKSFADKTIINFNSKVTGIVGPNGCGKSNIAEAIRWVLGEQSVKSLRSVSMSDVIFNGSSKRKMVNLAQVTLVFDNSSHVLDLPYDEVSISRKIHRNSSGGEYFINQNPVRLKDITDLISDSGIGKDSLSMISQGTVSNFAEAKPMERRAIFEEAAGVAKYKKRKNESLSKLLRTQENIDRVNDIVYELEKQVNPLKRAAKKAKRYQEKKERLQIIEIAVLVSLIDQLTKQIDYLEQDLFDVQTQSAIKATTIHVNETSMIQHKEQVSSFDKEVAALQEELMNVVSEIQILETRKIELDEKRKYALEVGDAQQKSEQLSSLLVEAQIEYEDRLERKDGLKQEIIRLNQKLLDINKDLLQEQTSFDLISNQLRKLTNRKDLLQNILERPFLSHAGVSAILNAKASLPGIINPVVDCLDVHPGYELAIDAALGAANSHIVSEDEQAARRAISFLKQNQSGRATFIPLTVLKERYVSKEALVVCDNTKGYLGRANQFVDDTLDHRVLSSALLQNVIVVDELEHGNHLASLLKYQYKIVTLDGDVIHKGGTMSGGRIKEHASIISAKAEFVTIDEKISTLTEQNQQQEHVLNKQRELKATTDEELLQNRIALAQLEPVVEAKRSKYERLKSELESLSPDTILHEGNFEEQLIKSLNHVYSKRDEITSSINSKREQKVKLLFELERKEKQLHQVRKEYNEYLSKERALELELSRMKTNYGHYVERLNSDYQMTIDYARTLEKVEEIEQAQQEVALLRQEIANMGNINMDAPLEYEEVNQRYEFLLEQLSQLKDAKDQLMAVINEMDTIMVERFSEMIQKINVVLPEVFSALFGGGKAKLVLDTPDDLLNTGVDIDVFPPGKTIKSIRLFSGGEKSLIAISVLFAILKVRHVPLCLFDEVEASLDQGNVERFANYLKTFADQTQFVVITHRPGTMTLCDVLYGVTMPEDGVSEMIRVQLIEAVKLSDDEGEEAYGIS